MFKLYLELGFTHILDLEAYDHMLFLLALVAFYVLKDWKKVVILATAFTIGHSITLALAVFDQLSLSSKMVEPLIPITIIITAVYNICGKQGKEETAVIYYLALFFGFIHGMGFSTLLKSSLMPGESIGLQLLAFNIGLELGQLLFVLLLLLINTLMINMLKIKEKLWANVLSGLAILVSLKLIFDLFT